jgi:anti-sigma-K factor RskA
MDYARPERADALAAQYVAGTLRGPARRRMSALLAAHPALAAAVHDWQERLMPLAAAVPEVTPPPRVWRAIEARLWADAARASGAATDSGSWWRGLAFWRGLTALASVGALVLSVALVRTPPALPPIVVVLQGQAGTAAAGASLVASVSGDGQAMVMQPVSAVAAVPGRVFELWSVPPQGAPRSLGLIDALGVTVLRRDRLPATLLKGGTSALAVSLEPPGGSPTGAPTGPVVFAGALRL